MIDKPPVPKDWQGPEWIEIDGQLLPFALMYCDCPDPWPICAVYGWGKCGRCGVRPEPKGNG